MFIRIFQEFKKSLPWVLLFLGLALLIIGGAIGSITSKKPLLDFSIENIKDILTGAGKIILISGVTTVTLNSYKFLGIFKEELTKVVTTPEHLMNKVDLENYWERVTKLMLKNKFPTINSIISKNVKEMYLPTTSVQYYDNYRQEVDIKYVEGDNPNELVEVTQTTRFTIIPVEANVKFEHTFINRISCGNIPSNAKFEVSSFKVNDKPQHIDYKNNVKDNCLVSTYSVTLEGKSGYNIEIVINKGYSLKDDNMIGHMNDYIKNKFRVQFFLKGVEIQFYSSGTLNEFKRIKKNNDYLEMDYDGLIYPRQGYISIIRKS